MIIKLLMIDLYTVRYDVAESVTQNGSIINITTQSSYEPRSERPFIHE